MISEEKLRTLYWEKGLSTREIGNKIGCSHVTVLRWMEKYNISRRKYKVYPNLTPSPSLSYILGVVDSDGSVFKTKRHRGWHRRVKLSTVNKKFADSFKDALLKINMPPYVKTETRNTKFSDGNTKFYIVLSESTVFYKWYESLIPKKKWSIVNKNYNNKREYIRGFFEGDGCSSISSEGYLETKIEIEDGNLLRKVHDLITSLGYNHFSFSKNSRGYYNLRNSTKEECQQFLDEINPRIKTIDN